MILVQTPKDGIRIEGLGNKRTSEDKPNYSTIEIG